MLVHAMEPHEIFSPVLRKMELWEVAIVLGQDVVVIEQPSEAGWDDFRARPR